MFSFILPLLSFSSSFLFSFFFFLCSFKLPIPLCCLILPLNDSTFALPHHTYHHRLKPAAEIKLIRSKSYQYSILAQKSHNPIHKNGPGVYWVRNSTCMARSATCRDDVPWSALLSRFISIISYKVYFHTHEAGFGLTHA